MKRGLLILLMLSMLSLHATAQTKHSSSRAGKPATPKTVSGTYRNVMNTLDVVEVPGQQVRLDFGGYWPNVPRSQLRKNGADTYNVGSFTETVPLKDGIAIVKLQFRDTPCVIRIRFLQKQANITQEGEANDCGFGFNVTAEGTYMKTSSRTPNIK